MLQLGRGLSTAMSDTAINDLLVAALEAAGVESVTIPGDSLLKGGRKGISMIRTPNGDLTLKVVDR